MQTIASSTTTQVYVELTVSGVSLVSPTGAFRAGNSSTSSNALGTANMSFIMTLASTGTAQIFVSMAHALNTTTPATYNFFNITVVGLS
jgi:hypothetical protein